MKLLPPEEIKDRLDRFNQNPSDWSVFDDVPEIQQINVLYPWRYDATKILDAVNLKEAK